MFEQGSYQEYRTFLFDLKRRNDSISNMYDVLLEKGSCDELCNDAKFSKEEFINLLALYNINDYREGGAGAHDDKQTDQGYSNTPLKFIEEFLQNADDCEYTEKPEIEISLDQTKNTIQFVYNETGFTRADIISLTARDKSTKVGLTTTEYPDDGIFYLRKTGRKGTGFKSVFSIDAENVIVHIRSNGFSFRLDREIGRTIPIIESEKGIEGKTCITVELINAKDPLDTVFERIKKIFCISDHYSFFRDNPLLFLRKIRTVSVNNILQDSNKSFSLSVDYNNRKYEDKIFTVNTEFEIESGIRNNAVFTESSFEHFNISVLNDGVSVNEINGFRYSKMIDIDNRYFVVSVMAPFINDNLQKWSEGSLFTTLPVIEHKFGLPYAIDAPFDLNDVRKALNYKNAEYNNNILKMIFSENGIMSEFLLKLAVIRDIRMDYYIKSGEVKIFNDDIDANLDSDRKRYIPVIDINKPLKNIPVFHKYYDSEGYVDYNAAVKTEREFYSWPDSEKFIILLMGDEYKENVISDIYMDSKLRFRNIADNGNFVYALNEYLDKIEAENGLHSDYFLSLLNKYIYPYLIGHHSDEPELLKQLKINVWKYSDGENVTLIREECHEHMYIDSKDEKYDGLCSFGKYRLWKSSALNIELTERLLKKYYSVKDIDIDFSEKNIKTTAKKFREWEDVLMFAQTAVYYQSNINALIFESCNGYCIPSAYDDEYNPYREAGIYKEIPETDIEVLSECLACPVSDTVKKLKKMCLGMPKSFFKRDKHGRIVLTGETRKLLSSSDEILSETFKLIDAELSETNDKLDVQPEDLEECDNKAYLFFLKRKNNYIGDTYQNLCDYCQNHNEFWNNNADPVVLEILLESLKNSKKKVNNPRNKELRLNIKDIIKHEWTGLVFELLEEKEYSFITVSNNEYFEERIREEILSLIQSLAPDKADDADGIKFYAGDMGNTTVRYINDGDSVYLHKSSDGDIYDSLIKYLGTEYDRVKIGIIQEMRNQYAEVYSEIIKPAIDDENGEIKQAYKEIEKKYKQGEICNREMINILSWFRYNGSAEAFGNGNISRQKQIESEYRAEPWRFVYEFIQNVDDCSFKAEHPELDVSIDAAKNRIVFSYNEDGFTFEDIKALTQFGASEKKERTDELYVSEGVFDLKPTGEKGIGFKSVFSLPGENIIVHIRSNSFSFKFIKKLGVIVPIWEENDEISAPGTQIIVEGFKDKTIDSFYNKLREILGFEAGKDLFALCPVFFLRKLRKISLSNGTDKCTIDMNSEIISVGEKSEFELSSAKCGIIYEGKLYKKIAERIKINITGINQPVTAVKVAEYLNDGTHDYVLSALAPVITDNSECRFEGGSLYATLPLSHNRLQIPVAFNTKFKLNDDRSAIADNKDCRNDFLSKILFGSVISDLYTELAHTEGICIKYYIPKHGTVLFRDEAYKFIEEVNIYNIISKIPVLKLYSGNGYISVSEALLLPEECYSWSRPNLIVKIFDKHEADILVLPEYSDIRIRWAKIVDDSFVDDMNSYLETLSYDECIFTLENYIYDYIMNNQYVQKRFSDKKTELAKLNILCFSMADGSTVRESIAAQGRYLVDGSDLKSCGIIRTISSSAVKLKDDFLTWISDICEIRDIDELFSELNENAFKYADSKQSVSELLCMLIYYGYESEGKIKYLRECALDSKLDDSYNVFRDTFIKTNDKSILREIITEDDILTMAVNLAEYGVSDDKTDSGYIISVIKKLGVKKSNDYFDFKDGVILHSSALAVLERNSDNREFTEKLLTDIANQKVKDINELKITYKDIRKCSEYVIISILKNEIIKSSYLYDLSCSYIKDNFINCSNADKSEALLRCFAVYDKKIYPNDADARINIIVKLSDIISRKLGEVLQKAYLGHLDEISLDIDTDEITLKEYPKEDINEVIKWMGNSEESILSDIPYEYYECDISQAFTGTDELFLLDDSSVILDNRIPENNMLYFVQKRFKGKAEKYEIMLSIRKWQNILQKWDNVNKTKEEYINALHDYREDNKKVLEDLCPDIEEIYNSSTDDAVEYVIPELLQNINDCKKGENEIQRILSVNIDDNYMTLKYPEKGFDYKNVYSITSIGKSTKNDSSEGEKGLGFKKVFSVFEEVEIYSNGFCFKLSHKDRTIDNTVPFWINDQKKQEKYLAEGYTTMRMKVKKNRNNDLKRLKKTWEDIFSGHYESGTVSPLFLSNIDGYELNGQENRIFRSDMEQGYYYRKINIYDTYRELLQDNKFGSEEIESKSDELVVLLEDRRKKRGMNEDEFKNYVKSLSLSVCIPKKYDKNYSGRFYSTLPTKNNTGIAVNINIPLELTTGRDAIDKNSLYNKKLIGFLFDTPDTEISVFSYLLKKVSEEKNGIELINYIAGIDELTSWAEQITNGINVNIQHSIKWDLRYMPLLNAAGKETLISLDEGFCLDYIAHKFINNNPQNNELIQKWLFENTEIGKNFDFVMISSEDKHEKLLKLAEYTAECKDRYPYTGEGELSLKFFDYVYGER